MGTYTEFHFNCELRNDVPYHVLNTLRYLIGDPDHDDDETLNPTPWHKFFLCPRWRMVGRGASESFSFTTHSRLKLNIVGSAYDLSINSSLKNYDDEIELFIEWISQYIRPNTDNFLGYYRSEESDNPTLIFQEYPDVCFGLHITNGNHTHGAYLSY